MEEVWKDINLSSLHDHLSSRDEPRPTTFHGMTFQDLLAQPFSTKPPVSPSSSLYSSPAPPPATILTFKSAQKPHFLGNSEHLKHNPLLPNPQVSQRDLPFGPSASATGTISNGNEKCPESHQNNSGDRRYKKMIKNRESAARSRARKQAYTDELELELARLLKENAQLKKQQQQLSLDVAVQEPKKYRLSRATSAPF